MGAIGDRGSGGRPCSRAATHLQVGICRLFSIRVPTTGTDSRRGARGCAEDDRAASAQDSPRGRVRSRRLLATHDKIGVLSLGQMVQSARLLGELVILLAQCRCRRHHIHIEKGAVFLPSLMKHLMHVVLRV